MIATTQLRTENKPAANMGFAIAGVPCFADTFVQGGSSVLQTKFSAKTPRHRKPPISCHAKKISALGQTDNFSFNYSFTDN